MVSAVRGSRALDAVLAAARDLGPVIRKAAPGNEASRRLDDATVTAMRETGLFRILLPAAYGGHELPLLDALEVIEEVAAADGSAGWCLLKGATSNQMAGYLDPAAAREIWADPSIVTAGSFNPRGRAVELPAGEGYRLTGRWDWGTGSAHSQWIICGAVVFDSPEATAPKPGPTPGVPEIKAFFVPRDEVTIHDTWFVAGMRATASHEFEVDDVLVPAGRAFDGMVAVPRVDSPNYAVPYIAQAMIPHAAVAVGIARGALADFRELAGVKVPLGGSSPLADRDRVVDGVGRAHAMVHAARATVTRAVEQAWATAAAEGRPTEAELAHLSIAATFATDLCVGAVDTVHSLAGGAGVFETSPLQRAFRDVHVAATHFLVNHDKYVLAGRALLTG
jgi:alkylation response protein AidB-like acyl-CoA dehydrogenase